MVPRRPRDVVDRERTGASGVDRDLVAGAKRDAVDTVVGYSRLVRFAWSPPDVFDLQLAVDPAHRRQGIGNLLWQNAQQHCVSLKATVLNTSVIDDQAADLKFARDRKFVEQFNRLNFKLDVAAFDDQKFNDLNDRTAALGIRISNMAEQGNTEDAQRKLFQLNAWCAALDLPGVKDEPSWDSWESFRQAVCGAPWYQPAGQFVAIDQQTGEWVGMCAVTYVAKSNSSDLLHTGVDRRYRRHPALGLALKRAGILYCKQLGATVMGDNLDARDAVNLAIDHALGFKQLPGWIMLEHRLG